MVLLKLVYHYFQAAYKAKVVGFRSFGWIKIRWDLKALAHLRLDVQKIAH